MSLLAAIVQIAKCEVWNLKQKECIIIFHQVPERPKYIFSSNKHGVQLSIVVLEFTKNSYDAC